MAHQRSRRTYYGYSRAHAELNALGLRCCIRGPKKHTTRKDECAVPTPELVARNFATVLPDRLWMADNITYVLDYIEAFYNRTRRHSSLGYESPADYEEATMKEAAAA